MSVLLIFVQYSKFADLKGKKQSLRYLMFYVNYCRSIRYILFDGKYTKN